MMRAFFVSVVVFTIAILVVGCTANADRKEDQRKRKQAMPAIERLAGDTDVIPPAEVLDKGKVLISYSDCATCHKAADRKRGPAFHDIAVRYPMNNTYMDILAKRIVLGAKGAWGNAVMPPHPTISDEDARTMVMYILSLDHED